MRGALLPALEARLRAEGMDAADPTALGPLHTGGRPVARPDLDRPQITLPPDRALSGPRTTGGRTRAPALPGIVSTPVPSPGVLGNGITERRARRLLEAAEGPPPTGMDRPHAHHVLPQTGIGSRQQALVREGRAILQGHGIDPDAGLENLTWAPNVKGQHTTAKVKDLVRDLRDADAGGASHDVIVEILKEYAQIAQNHRAPGSGR